MCEDGRERGGKGGSVDNYVDGVAACIGHYFCLCVLPVRCLPVYIGWSLCVCVACKIYSMNVKCVVGLARSGAL